MALLVVHAVGVVRVAFRAMALDTVGDRFRRLPFRRLPPSGKVFVERMRHGVDYLTGHLGAALVFLPGGDFGAGSHGPAGNRRVTERCHRLDLDLAWELRDIVEAFRWKFHLCIPPHHPIDDGLVGVVFVVEDKVDQAGADAQCPAKGAVAGVPGSGMNEHVLGHGVPGMADLFFQEAGEPQPSAVPSSAGLRQVAAVGPPACLHGIEFCPRPRQRGRFALWPGFRQLKAGTARYSSGEEKACFRHEIAAGQCRCFLLFLFHKYPFFFFLTVPMTPLPNKDEPT